MFRCSVIGKNFMPQKLRNKFYEKKLNEKKRAIVLFLILNFIFLPLNLQNNNKDISENIAMNLENTDLYENINKENIIDILEIYNKSILDIEISDNIGKIITNDENIIYYLERKGFDINEVNYAEKEYSITFKTS